MSPPLLYPFTLGMLAAVNPCGFPLLPAYLDLFAGRRAPGEPVPTRMVRALSAAVLATFGILVLFGGLGAATYAGWSAVADRSFGAARYVMVAVGVVLTVVGLLALAGRPIPIRLPNPGPGRSRRRPVALALFGFSYGVASIGCSLPLFVTGVVSEFGHSSPERALTGLLAYGLGMASVLGGLSVAVAAVGAGAGRSLRRLSRWVPLAGGVLLSVTGVYVTWYWVADIVDPTRTFLAERAVNYLQQQVSSGLGGHATAVGAALGAVLVAAVVAAGLRSGRPGVPAPASHPGGPAPHPGGPAPPPGVAAPVSRRLR